MESCMEIDVYQNQKLLIVSDMATNANVGKQVMKKPRALVSHLNCCKWGQSWHCGSIQSWGSVILLWEVNKVSGKLIHGSL